MNHRHLLPNEIDLLVDGEAGFGVAPLRAHVEQCDACRAELDQAREIAVLLEQVPHLAPSIGFADRVMAEVPVFVPWHVAVRDAVMSRIPRSRPLRVMAAAVATSIAGLVTLATLWVLAQGDLMVFAAGAMGERVRDTIVVALRDAAVALLGEGFVAAIGQIGTVGVAIAGAAFLIAAAGAVAGLRAIAVSGRSRS
ncbi:MAG: hypothetical protein ACYC3Q_03260 [Gemmatimonadaceae bacterium]